jgi:flagellar biosynthetic protein FliS
MAADEAMSRLNSRSGSLASFGQELRASGSNAMLPTASGADVYRRLHVESRTPLELVVMLYDGALTRVAEARAALERGDLRAYRDAIGRALAIIGELQNTLDLRLAATIAKSLGQLCIRS